MKYFKLCLRYLIIFTTLVLLNECSVKDDYYPEGALKNFNDLLKEFENPSKEYGTAPLYVWNSVITREGIEDNLQDLKKAGFGGVFVHPRPGLITEYISETWFDLFRYTVDKAKELDMNVWIYDENSYPSGFGGGHVPAEMPESYNQGQGLQPEDTTQIPVNFEEYYLILKKVDGEFVDITSSAEEDRGKLGEYTLFTKTFYEKSDWHGGWSYVDLLYPGVTEKFIEVTMTGYEEIAGDEFGKTVPGVFTDEPEIKSSGGIRWTPDLFAVFESQWGYDLIPNLPSLYKETGDWKKVRHNYTQTLLWLFIERWAKPQFAYSEEKGLAFTGHYWEHGWPGMRLGGDNMAMYAYHQMPGIDMLFNQFNEHSPNAQFGNIRAVKELASAANQFGRRRTMSETYGGGGWELTFEDMKRLGDWEYALGVNFMNQHLSHYTLAGARKYDYPPSFMAHSPWWTNYKYLNDYFKRLSLVLSSGKQNNDILVLEPTTSAWLYDSYIRDSRNKQFEKVGASFQEFVTKLEKTQVEYDLGSEDILKNHGSVYGKQLKVGNIIYSKVVIPPYMENLNKSTFNLLQEFAAKGGEILAFSNPTLVDGASSDELAGLFDKDQQLVQYFPELSKEVLATNFKNKSLSFEKSNGGNLYHHRREMKDGQILFLVNSSLEEESSGVFQIKGKDAVVMNAFSGGISNIAEVIDGENIRVPFQLAPAESMLLYISNSKLKGNFKPTKDIENYDLISTSSSMEIEQEMENVLTIDFCDLEVSGKSEKDMHVYEAATMVFKENGFENGNPWNHSIQYKTSVLDQGNFAEESGFTATYNFNISEEFDFSNIRAVVERPELWRFSINGNEVEPLPGEWWLDRSFGVFSIGKWIQLGNNEIVIKCYPMKIHAEIEPVYLVGDFLLESESKGWKMMAPSDEFTMGSWKDQGLPFYSWGFLYKKDFDIEEDSGNYYLALGKWNGTAVEVMVNESSAGTIALHSDRLDVSDFIQKGTNKVEVKVIGSLKNLLGPHHNNPPEGIASPWTWRGIKNYPPGQDYQMLDYGLYGDIYLYGDK